MGTLHESDTKDQTSLKLIDTKHQKQNKSQMHIYQLCPHVKRNLWQTLTQSITTPQCRDKGCTWKKKRASARNRIHNRSEQIRRALIHCWAAKHKREASAKILKMRMQWSWGNTSTFTKQSPSCPSRHESCICKYKKIECEYEDHQNCLLST